MPNSLDYRVVINTRRSNSLVALFDMMRYDHATIVDWTHGTDGLVPVNEGADQWTITLRSVTCTRDRWGSFGMPVFDGR